MPVVRLFSRLFGESIDLEDAGLGFTLPANIGDLDPGTTELNLSNCNLIGALTFLGFVCRRKLAAMKVTMPCFGDFDCCYFGVSMVQARSRQVWVSCPT